MQTYVPETGPTFRVHGTEIHPDDTPERYLQKLARVTLEEMFQLTCVLTTEGILLDCSRALTAAAGLTRDEVVGKPFCEILRWAPEAQIHICDAIACAAKGELVRHEAEVFRGKCATDTIAIDFTLHPVSDETGRVRFLLFEAHDLTEPVREKQALERAGGAERSPRGSGEPGEGYGRPREAHGPFQAIWEQGLFAGRLDLKGNVIDLNAVLWITDANGSCLYVSHGWSDFTGQSEQAALGFGWLEAVHPDDREEARGVILKATGKREAFSLDCRLRRANGEFHWALSSGRPRFNPDGTFEGFAGSIIDIDERKQVAQASALLSAIVDSSDDAIISKDLNGTIMSWNKGAERLFGYTAAETIGRSIVMLIPPDRVDEEPRILEQLKRGERVDHFETIRMRKDGSLLNISLTISPVKDAEGRIIGASKIARDITDRVRQEAALQEANAALTRANEDLQQFAYSASHDLQEPLRIVALYSALLQRKFGGQLGSDGDEYIRYTIEGVRRMENLLQDLRTYMQVSAADPEPIEEIDAGAVLKKTLLNLEVAVQESGAAVNSTVLPRVRMHEFQLEQIFQNLIGNAIRYRSSLPPRIQIAAVLQGRDWLFSVEDNGIGIEPQFRQQIFGLFKRLHSTATHSGTGMGLAICQRTIERAGGRIWVESEPGRGSTFYFTIPAGKSQERGQG